MYKQNFINKINNLKNFDYLHLTKINYVSIYIYIFKYIFLSLWKIAK